MNSSSNLPKVSIITPSFNQGQFLEASIRSVLEQDYPNIEYIVVDGGSRDDSVEIIKKYQKHLAWWVSEKDKGHADALNKGFSRATGEILAWLNSDDIYFPGAVSEAVSVLQSHPKLGMVYGDADLIDDSGETVGQFGSKQTSYRQMLRGSVHIPQATTFFRADIWRQVGPLDLSLFLASITTCGCASQKYHRYCTFPSAGQSSASMVRVRQSSTTTAVTRTCCACLSAKAEAGSRGCGSG